MALKLRDVMTPSPIALDAGATVAEAAQAMAADGIGDVLVIDGDDLCGIVTDRDLVVRAVAQGKDPAKTTLGEIATADLVAVAATDSADTAVKLMRERAVRRLPVMEDGNVVGMVSLGDLAVELDDRSALADISAAPPTT